MAALGDRGPVWIHVIISQSKQALDEYMRFPKGTVYKMTIRSAFFPILAISTLILHA
jgi:hypothetical protein